MSLFTGRGVCSKCGDKLGGFLGTYGRNVKGTIYCYRCCKSIPTCDKCKYYYNHWKYKEGCCGLHDTYLTDRDDTCGDYEKGMQVYRDVDA